MSDRTCPRRARGDRLARVFGRVLAAREQARDAGNSGRVAVLTDRAAFVAWLRRRADRAETQAVRLV